MAKPSIFVIDKTQTVHFRYCAQGQPYFSQTVIEEPPFLTDTKTAEQMLANLERGDGINQFDAKHRGPSAITACPDCIIVETS